MKIISSLKKEVSIFLIVFFTVNVFCAYEIESVKSVKGNRAVVIESKGLLGRKAEKLDVKRFYGYILNIRGNKVGLEDSDVCAAINDKGKFKVICKSGRVFANPGRTIGSATGTPSHLMYKNYIGSYIPKIPRTISRPGEARRVTYCEGPCEKIE